MPHNFTRPNLPYANVSLPNDNRFQVITRSLNSPPTDIMYDSEYNYIIDGMNILDNDIINVVAGNIPGSSIPTNANRFLTTDGNGNLSWILVGINNVSPGSLPATVLINSSITSLQIADGAITNTKLGPNSVVQGNLSEDSVGTNQIQDNAVGTNELALSCVTAAQMANKTITATQIADNTITLLQLATSIFDYILPIGSIIEFSGTTGVGANFLECNGQLVSRTTYSILFANIGTTYGTGDGSTTFALPDRRGTVSVGIGSDNSTNGKITNSSAPSIVLGASFGNEQVTLDTTQIPSHIHPINYVFIARNPPQNNDTSWSLPYAGGSNGTYNSNAAGGGLPHSNVQPSIFQRFYIRAL